MIFKVGDVIMSISPVYCFLNIATIIEVSYSNRYPIRAELENSKMSVLFKLDEVVLCSETLQLLFGED